MHLQEQEGESHVIKVNPTQNNSAQSLVVILICCVVGLAIAFAVIAAELHRTSNFVEVTGTITNVSQKVDLGIENNSKATVIKYVHTSYEVNGEVYCAKNRTFFAFSKHVGGKTVVKYDPSNPTDIQNPFIIEASGCAVFFLGLFIVFLSLSIFKKHREEIKGDKNQQG